MYRSAAAQAAGVRAANMPCSRATSIDTSQGAARGGRRAAADRRNHRIGEAVRALRLSPGNRFVARCWLDGEPKACRADLAQGRAQGATAPAETGSAMA